MLKAELMMKITVTTLSNLMSPARNCSCPFILPRTLRTHRIRPTRLLNRVAQSVNQSAVVKSGPGNGIRRGLFTALEILLENHEECLKKTSCWIL